MTSRSPAAPSLRRELGKWDLTAIGVNQVIGGSIFLMPALVAVEVGSWSVPALLLVGALSFLIALNFAEAGSRFDGTGGAYLYTRAAFGRFAGFEIGWMLWVTRVASWASIVNGLVDALGFYWPVVRTGPSRTGMLILLVAAITAVNVRGIRQSAWVVNTLTIGKLLPLALFVLLGLPHITAAAVAPSGSVTWSHVSTAALYLIFTFGGYEVVPVPAGEARDPKRAVPFAMLMTILICTVVMALVQVVAMGTLPDLRASKTPLADAALRFIGPWGALMMTAAAAVSMSGNNVGQALSGSRNLFGLAEQGDVPRVFGTLHPRFATPIVAILSTGAVSLALALSGSFSIWASVSAVTRLLVYVGTCASVLALRRQGRAAFTIPLGPVVPAAAIAVSLAILYGATAIQLEVGAAGIGLGALLYVVTRWRK
jgi:amino acid transporter